MQFYLEDRGSGTNNVSRRKTHLIYCSLYEEVSTLPWRERERIPLYFVRLGDFTD
jgi:hypothetical protein